jgi:hypothetical protein
MWHIWRVIGDDVSSDSDGVFDWYVLTGKDDSNGGGSWGKIYYLVLWWCLSFSWRSWWIVDTRGTLCVLRFFARYCFPSVPAANVRLMNDSHHSWLRNQQGTLNKINLRPTSLFHSAAWLGPAVPSSGRLVYVWKILTPASLQSWENAVYRNFIPSIYTSKWEYSCATNTWTVYSRLFNS